MNVSSRREFMGVTALGSAGLAAASAMPPGSAAPADSSRKVRIGVVGGGFGASFQWHLHPNCEVAAVTDLRADRRKRLRDAYRCDTFFDSLEQMLERAPDLDAVAVFTGAADHYRHVEMCMNRGLHVISAVPACFSLEEADKLKDLKERTGLRYMMAETSYYRQACIYARNLYRSGGFGEVFYSEVEYYHDRGDLQKLVTNKASRFFHPDGSRTWRWGLAPLHYPTHSLGFVVGVTGERIRSVSALGWGSPHPWIDENVYGNPHWNQSALMQTDKGHMVRCNVFWLTADEGERAQWFGDKGSLYMAKDGLHPDKRRQRMHEAEELEVPSYWDSEMLPEPMRVSSGHGGSHAFLTAEFINALVEDREPVIDVYESLAMTVPGIVGHRSALNDGERMKVPPFDKPA